MLLTGGLEGSALRRAASADIVLVASESLEAVRRVDLYRRLGVEARLYPLRVDDSPHIGSLLGLAGWIHSELRQGKVVFVESFDDGAFIAALVSLVVTPSERLVRMVAGKLSSPLQLRSLHHVLLIAREGVNLERLSLSLRTIAFTGGDAARFELAENLLDLVELLPCLSRCVGSILQEGEPYRQPPSLPCRIVSEELKNIDLENSGAVRVLAPVHKAHELTVYFGCRFMDRDGCKGEASRVIALFKRLGGFGCYFRGDPRGGSWSSVRAYPVFPEEAACIRYGKVYGVCDVEQPL